MGFSLAEILVGMAIACMAGALVFRLLLAQMNFFRDAHHARESLTRLEEAEAILSAELRSVASGSDTVRMLADSAVETLTQLGASLACNTVSAGESTLVLVPTELSSQNVLSSFLYPPDSGDLVAIHAHDSTGDSWKRRQIAKVSIASTSVACPPANGFTSAADATSQAYLLTLRNSASAVARGSFVRILRRSRFSLYRSSDGDWYLGHRRCHPAGCLTVQPVAGPFLPYRATGSAGIRFSALDSAGSPAGAPADIAAIDVELRLPPARGMPSPASGEVHAVTIAPRNRQ